MSEWKSISTAPKDGTRVLVWSKTRAEIAHWDPEPTRWEGEGACWTVYDANDHFYSIHLVDDEAPTHWMPLPSEPSPIGGRGKSHGITHEKEPYVPPQKEE